jgi:hypothetical protein
LGKHGFPEGKSIQINSVNKDTLILEYLKIQRKGSQISYLAQVPNQNKGKIISFQLTQQDSSSYLFENLTHDFPQTIHYHFKLKDELTVTLKGQSNKGVKKEIALTFRRLNFSSPVH